ncbi:hypothetical protein NW768_007213 [Fusarium equiseti]|uniref:Uncharacterized protein n=1 Tax=Fusarium equiseti TaxID=61235 RepID=A0ABQ8RAE4_FUSEQ|nr:hypothetical protein NW768_007213 [Fusarium equiseti]
MELELPNDAAFEREVLVFIRIDHDRVNVQLILQLCLVRKPILPTLGPSLNLRKSKSLCVTKRCFSSNLECNTQAIQKIQQEHAIALAPKDREIELLRDSLTDLRQGVKARDDLVSVLKGSKASSYNQLQALRDLRERDETTLRQIGELHLKAAKVAELSDKNKALEERLQQQAHYINGLKNAMKAPARSNELCQLFYRLYSGVQNLKIDTMGDVEGQDCVNRLATVILSVGGSRRFVRFVERVDNSNLYCFTDVCLLASYSRS